MRHPLRALSATLGAIHDLYRAGEDHHAEVRATLAIESRSAVERATAEMRVAEATTIERISVAVAASAEKALFRRVRVFDRNTALTASIALFMITTAAVGAGYAWGRNATRAAYRQTETGLSEAFRKYPEAARGWLSLMEANDPRQVIGRCTGGDAWSAPDGRRACRAAIWLDPPKPSIPTPPTAPRPIVSR
jgi:hypothetical protein